MTLQLLFWLWSPIGPTITPLCPGWAPLYSHLPCDLSLLFSFFQPFTLSLSSDLARYFQGLGPPPKFQVTLNFWEESPSPNHTPKSLITVQVSSGWGKASLPVWVGWGWVPGGEGASGGKELLGVVSAPAVLMIISSPPFLAQMEQAFARHLLEETPEEQSATLSPPLLGDPSSSSPLFSSYLL